MEPYLYPHCFINHFSKLTLSASWLLTLPTTATAATAVLFLTLAGFVRLFDGSEAC